jgi:hypothetical protein
VARNVLGSAPRIKYSPGASKLSRAVASVASQPVLITAYNFNYYDTGLFGINIIANKSDVGKVRF